MIEFRKMKLVRFPLNQCVPFENDDQMPYITFDFWVSDLAVDKVFSENGGVLGFVKLCLKQLKTFKSETVKAFELFTKITELYPSRVSSHATDVVIVRRILFYYNIHYF